MDVVDDDGWQEVFAVEPKYLCPQPRPVLPAGEDHNPICHFVLHNEPVEVGVEIAVTEASVRPAE